MLSFYDAAPRLAWNRTDFLEKMKRKRNNLGTNNTAESKVIRLCRREKKKEKRNNTAANKNESNFFFVSYRNLIEIIKATRTGKTNGEFQNN